MKVQNIQFESLVLLHLNNEPLILCFRFGAQMKSKNGQDSIIKNRIILKIVARFMK